MISLHNILCISTAFLGVIKCLEPSMCDENSAPSSLNFRKVARLNIWYPPLSVNMGRSQPMNLCRPPAFSIISSPGRK